MSETGSFEARIVALEAQLAAGATAAPKRSARPKGGTEA